MGSVKAANPPTPSEPVGASNSCCSGVNKTLLVANKRAIMFDPGSIAAIAASLKTAGDIAKTMIGLRDTAVLQAKTIELQGMILSAQSSAFSAQQERSALVDKIGALEAEMARMEAWDAEKLRYELKRWGKGAFTYVLKESEARGEPMHALCAACYERAVKSVLQANGEIQWAKHAWNCPTCKFSVKATSGALQNPEESI